MPASTAAGVITASASAFTAVALMVSAMIGLIRSRRVEDKVDQGNAQIAEVHVIVNQQRTDMQTVIINQQRQLLALEEAMAKAGLTMPVATETTGEPIVATSVITHEVQE